MDAIPAESFGEYVARIADAMEHALLTDAMEACIPILRQSVRDNFTSSASPSGQDWAPRQRQGDGHPLLMDTGRLLQAATGGGAGAITEVADRSAMIGVASDQVPYAAIHHHGGLRRPMPQRAYMGARDDAIQECREVLAEHAVQLFDVEV